MISDRDVADVRPHGLDNTGTLVTHDRRGWKLPFSVEHVSVRAANTGGPHPYQDLTRPWVRDLHSLDLEPVTTALMHGS